MEEEEGLGPCCLCRPPSPTPHCAWRVVSAHQSQEWHGLRGEQVLVMDGLGMALLEARK